jgi:ribosomal protein L32
MAKAKMEFETSKSQAGSAVKCASCAKSKTAGQRCTKCGLNIVLSGEEE